jgi:hypothetical protein
MPFLALQPSRYESTPGSVGLVSEVLSGPQRVVTRPFYFEDSQVVLQASLSITMFPSACNHLFIHR